ncbi:MAG: LCP family protein [Actinomycetales bacterium]
MSRRARHGARRRHPVIRGILTAFAFVLAAAIGFTAFAVFKLQSNINSIDISSALGERPSVMATADEGTDLLPLNILLVGSDTRTELQNADEFGGTSDLTSRDHSDTTILLHVAADRKSAYGISIPRDSMVHRPDCQNPDAVPLDETPIGMFNSAYNDGGIGCTVMTVEANTGVRIDHYAVVNFEGFSAMVDALGGVDICLNEPAHDTATGLDLPAGVSHLSGHEASQFVRARKGFGDGSDLGRIDRQQAFLSALIREATDSKLLLRPDRLYSFLSAATDSVTMDTQLASISSMSDLALQLKSLSPDQVQFITVPNETYPKDHNRVQWLPEADDIWMAARIDSPLPGQPGSRVGVTATAVPAAAPTVSPAKVSVTLVNSSGTPGLAKQAAGVLEVQGFDILGYETGKVGTVQGAVIRYPRGEEKALATLQAAFPGASVESSSTLDHFVVDLGPGAPDVVEVPNRLGDENLPEQPISVPSKAGDVPDPASSLHPRLASNDACADAA